jgi:hypothetical protein
LIFSISNELVAIGSFEIDEMEREANDTLVAQINESIILHANRQIYARARDFSYLLKHSKTVMRGTDLLDDLATARSHYSDEELGASALVFQKAQDREIAAQPVWLQPRRVH